MMRYDLLGDGAAAQHARLDELYAQEDAFEHERRVAPLAALLPCPTCGGQQEVAVVPLSCRHRIGGGYCHLCGVDMLTCPDCVDGTATCEDCHCRTAVQRNEDGDAVCAECAREQAQRGAA